MAKTKPIKFDELRRRLVSRVERLSEHRKGKNISYSLQEVVLSAFSVFYMQSASFLAHQKLVEKQKGNNNLRTLFGVEKMPSDPQIRNLLDPIAPEQIDDVFGDIVELLADRGHLDAYRTFDRQLLCALDGTRYFDSQTLHCVNCWQRSASNGVTTYAHYAVLPVLAKPGKREVLALAPAFIRPQDGQEKQDCEINAAKRWLQQQGPRYASWTMTLLGDDLYCHQPFCDAALAAGFNFILVCKPESHETLYGWLAAIDQRGGIASISERVWNGRHGEIWRYQFLNELPLRLGEDALLVNWCDLRVVHEETGEQLYHNSFATNHLLTADSVKPIAQVGRARWKVENEGNNVLKTKGYHLEHNFGHGQTYLAMTLLMLNLLAFLFHTVLELANDKYRLLRQELAARYRFFNDLQALTRYLTFDSWDDLMDFMLAGLELSLPP
jgi:hypothetical protein